MTSSKGQINELSRSIPDLHPAALQIWQDIEGTSLGRELELTAKEIVPTLSTVLKNIQTRGQVADLQEILLAAASSIECPDPGQYPELLTGNAEKNFRRRKKFEQLADLVGNNELPLNRQKTYIQYP